MTTISRRVGNKPGIWDKWVIKNASGIYYTDTLATAINNFPNAIVID
jgi:hypothetical protein